MKSAFILAVIPSVFILTPVESREAALQSLIKIKEDPKQETSFAGSEQEFNQKFESAISRLEGCYLNKEIDPVCYYDAKTAMVNVAGEVENYNVSKSGKWLLENYLQQNKVYVFPILDEKANKKCGEPTNNDAVCKHFNFEIYTKAVKNVEKKTRELLNIVKSDANYFGNPRGMESKELHVLRKQLRELANIYDKKWDNEPAVKEVNYSYNNAKDLQQDIIAIRNTYIMGH